MRNHNLKRRDRASYEFALASAAVILQMDGRKIHKAQVAMGGVGTIRGDLRKQSMSWRDPKRRSEISQGG